MNAKDIIAFKESIENLSLNELKVKKTELNAKIAQMIMDCDLTMKLAILEAKIKEKGE